MSQRSNTDSPDQISPFSLPQHDWNDYRSLEPTDDHTWAHRVVVHCADVLMYCYGEHRSNNSDYDASVEYHASWDRLRPKSFEPIYSKPADPSQGEVWPELWYLSDCHGTLSQRPSSLYMLSNCPSI